MRSVVLPADGTLPDGRNAPEQPDQEAGPSPLLRWTSDGSMMEELLRTFTCAPHDIPSFFSR